MREIYLKDEEVFLSQVEESDTHIIREIANSEYVRKFMSSSLPKTDEDILNEIKNSKLTGSPYFIILIPDKNNIVKEIGYVKLEILSNIFRAAEIHLAIKQEFTGKGYGKKVIGLATKYAFEDLNIHSVRAFIKDGNIASMKAFESQKYKQVGIIEEGAFYKGIYNDCYIYNCLHKYII